MHKDQKAQDEWITDLNVKHKAIKLLENNIGENLGNLRNGDDFLDTTPEARSMKEIINKPDFTEKLLLCRSQCQENEKISRGWEKISVDTSDKGLFSKTYKVLLKLNSKKTT